MTKLAAGTRIAPYSYQIIKQLGAGEGGMSLVYLAALLNEAHEDTGERVALKIAITDPKLAEFFRATLDNEVEHLRALKGYPGIVQLFPIRGQGLPPNPIYSAQLNLAGHSWFSVMEYLSGGSLADMLRSQPRPDLRVALQIIAQIAETLAHVHRAGRVHLDIKPENIVFRRPLSEGIESVLVDFGIARGIGQGGLEAGTLQWSPPERVAAQQRAGSAGHVPRPHPSMDVYALGLVLYRLITGKLPYTGSREKLTSEIIQGSLRRPSAINPAIPPQLDDLTLAALARQPDARPTAETLLAQLQAVLEGSPEVSSTEPAAVVSEPTRPVVLPAPAMPTPTSRRVTPWVSAAVVVLVLAMSFLWARSAQPPGSTAQTGGAPATPPREATVTAEVEVAAAAEATPTRTRPRTVTPTGEAAVQLLTGPTSTAAVRPVTSTPITPTATLVSSATPASPTSTAASSATPAPSSATPQVSVTPQASATLQASATAQAATPTPLPPPSPPPALRSVSVSLNRPGPRDEVRGPGHEFSAMVSGWQPGDTVSLRLSLGNNPGLADTIAVMNSSNEATFVAFLGDPPSGYGRDYWWTVVVTSNGTQIGAAANGPFQLRWEAAGEPEPTGYPVAPDEVK